MANLEQLISDLDALTSADKGTLVSMLEERWGIKSSYVVGIQSGPVPDAPKAVEKTEFDVVLTGFKDKISCIKEIRAITGLDLKSAKDFVEAAPKVVKAEISKDEAEAIAGRIRAAGGDVEIK